MVKTRTNENSDEDLEDTNEKSASNSRKNVKILGQRKVFYMKDEIFKSLKENETLDVVKLRNPGTDESSYYVFTPDQKMYELMQFSEVKRSWFINESVCSNGVLYMTTPVDPLYFILRFLHKQCQSRAMVLDQFVMDEDFPETHRLLEAVALTQIELIGDRKDIQDLVTFKYNEEKTLEWLKIKCERVASILKEKKVFVGQGAISSTYIKSEKIEGSIDSGEYLRFAHGILSDYISEEISGKLAKHLDIPEELTIVQKKRKSGVELEAKNSKKTKLDSDDVLDSKENIKKINEESFEEKKVKVVEKKVTTKEKQLAKAASGSKSISSFFMKK